MPNDAVAFSVVVPAYNERDNVEPLARQVVEALKAFPSPYEVVMVDDCSSDDTWAQIQKCAKQFPQVRGIRQPRRGGQSCAMLTGMREARGEVIVTMDGDLQNDPADIPQMLERLNVCDAVCGYRANRRDTWSRRVGSRLANRVRNLVTQDGMRDTGCSLKAFRKACVPDLPPLTGVHRFMPAYFRLNGRRIEEMAVNHRARQHGQSKYTNLKRLPKTIMDLFGFWWYRSRYFRLSAKP